MVSEYIQVLGWWVITGISLILSLITLRLVSSTLMRMVIVVLLVSIPVALWFGIENTLGNPRPVKFNILKQTESARVLYAAARKGEGIFILLATDGPPIYYRIPWTKETAEELRRALDQARKRGAPLMFRYEPTLEYREKFYAAPQPKLLRKPPPPRGIEYKSREWSV